MQSPAPSPAESVVDAVEMLDGGRGELHQLPVSQLDGHAGHPFIAVESVSYPDQSSRHSPQPSGIGRHVGVDLSSSRSNEDNAPYFLVIAMIHG